MFAKLRNIWFTFRLKSKDFCPLRVFTLEATDNYDMTLHKLFVKTRSCLISNFIFTLFMSNLYFYLYTVTSRYVKFRYPDRMSQSEFVHIAKKFLLWGKVKNFVGVG
jgi:hypothetical protein